MNWYLGILYQTYETCNHNSDINLALLMGWYCRASEHLKDSQDNWITCVKLRCGDSANSSSDGSLTPPAVCNSIVLMSATLPRYRNIFRKTRGLAEHLPAEFRWRLLQQSLPRKMQGKHFPWFLSFRRNYGSSIVKEKTWQSIKLKNFNLWYRLAGKFIPSKMHRCNSSTIAKHAKERL